MAQVLNLHYRLRYRNARIPVKVWVNPRNHLHAKRFWLLSSIIERKLQEKDNVSNKIPCEEEELDRYFSATHIIDDKVDHSGYNKTRTIHYYQLLWKMCYLSQDLQHLWNVFSLLLGKVHVGNETVCEIKTLNMKFYYERTGNICLVLLVNLILRELLYCCCLLALPYWLKCQ